MSDRFLCLFFQTQDMSGVAISGNGELHLNGSKLSVTRNGATVSGVFTGTAKGNESERFGLAKEPGDGKLYVQMGPFGKFEVPSDFEPGTLVKLADVEVENAPFNPVVVNNGVEFDKALPCVAAFKGTREFRIRTPKGVFRVSAKCAYFAGGRFVVDGVEHDVGPVSCFEKKTCVVTQDMLVSAFLALVLFAIFLKL